VRRLVVDSDKLILFPARHYSHNFCTVVESRNMRNNPYTALADALTPTVKLNALRSNGIILSLVQLLAPQLLPAYTACFAHLMLVSEERRAIDALATEFGRPEL
jgi:hypothetical protein